MGGRTGDVIGPRKAHEPQTSRSELVAAERIDRWEGGRGAARARARARAGLNSPSRSVCSSVAAFGTRRLSRCLPRYVRRKQALFESYSPLWITGFVFLTSCGHGGTYRRFEGGGREAYKLRNPVGAGVMLSATTGLRSLDAMHPRGDKQEAFCFASGRAVQNFEELENRMSARLVGIRKRRLLDDLIRNPKSRAVGRWYMK
jgi:hypothetical protein